MCHSDLRVIGFGGWRGDQYQGRGFSGGLPRFFDQAPSDSMTLIFGIDREIGKITAIREIGDGSRYADEPVAVPCGDDQIGVAEHGVETRKIIGGATFGERRCDEDLLEFLRGEMRFEGIGDGHGRPVGEGSGT